MVVGGFPSFLPKEVEKIKDPFARSLAQRIQRLPVQVYHSSIFLLLALHFLIFLFFYVGDGVNSLNCLECDLFLFKVHFLLKGIRDALQLLLRE